MADLITCKKEDLVSIADKIRTLVGTSEGLSLGDMSSNTAAANEDIANIKTALADKGVEVSDDTKLADLAGLVEAIKSGGAIICDSFTVAEASDTPITIDLTEYGYTPIGGTKVSNCPRAIFLMEASDLGSGDTTHTKRRVLLYSHIAKSIPVYSESGSAGRTGFYSILVYQSSGSTSISTSTNSVASMWYQTSDPKGGTYGVLTGYTYGTQSTIKFCITESGTYSLIPGRTYIWGVVL